MSVGDVSRTCVCARDRSQPFSIRASVYVVTQRGQPLLQNQYLHFRTCSKNTVRQWPSFESKMSSDGARESDLWLRPIECVKFVNDFLYRNVESSMFLFWYVWEFLKINRSNECIIDMWRIRLNVNSKKTYSEFGHRQSKYSLCIYNFRYNRVSIIRR